MDCFLHLCIMARDSNTQAHKNAACFSRKKGRIAMTYTRRYNPATSPWDILLTFPIRDPIDINWEIIARRSIGSYSGFG
jgi:hypothetical protein